MRPRQTRDKPPCSLLSFACVSSKAAGRHRAEVSPAARLSAGASCPHGAVAPVLPGHELPSPTGAKLPGPTLQGKQKHCPGTHPEENRLDARGAGLCGTGRELGQRGLGFAWSRADRGEDQPVTFKYSNLAILLSDFALPRGGMNLKQAAYGGQGDYKSRSDLRDHFIRKSKCPRNPWLSSALAAPHPGGNPRFIIALGSAALPAPGTSRAANGGCSTPRSVSSRRTRAEAECDHGSHMQSRVPRLSPTSSDPLTLPKPRRVAVLHNHRAVPGGCPHAHGV